MPLTAGGGFHQLDDRSPLYLRDLLERHPAAPFLSLHHEGAVFKAPTQVLPRQAFFASMWHDPVNFLRASTVEVRSGPGGTTDFVASVASGLSVRLWRVGAGRGEGGESGAWADVLWSEMQSRSEVSALLVIFTRVTVNLCFLPLCAWRRWCLLCRRRSSPRLPTCSKSTALKLDTSYA